MFDRENFIAQQRDELLFMISHKWTIGSSLTAAIFNYMWIYVKFKDIIKTIKRWIIKFDFKLKTSSNFDSRFTKNSQVKF